MSYDHPERRTYSYVGLNLSSADQTKIIRGPKGKRARIKNAEVSVTTTTAGATTTPKVQAGISGTLNKYLDWDIGAVTAPAGKSADAQSPAVLQVTNYEPYYHPADTDLYLTFKAATGSGAAGVLDAHVIVDWF